MFGSDSPPSVNTKLLNANRENMDRMAQFSEDTAIGYDAFRNEMNQYTTDLMQNVVSQQMQAFNQQFQNSKELMNLAKSDRAYYDKYYKPIEEQVRKDATEWDSLDNTQKAIGEARADVNDTFAAQKRNQRAQLESYGVDPSMTRETALDRGVDVMKAAEQARAGNQARDGRQIQAMQMRANLANQGNTIANRALTTAAQGQQGLAQAARTGALTTGTANQTAQANNAGYQQAGNMYGQVGNQYGNINQDYLNQYTAQMEEHNNTVDPMQTVMGIGSTILGGMAGTGAFNQYLPTGGNPSASVGKSAGGAVPTPEEMGVSPVPQGQIIGDAAGTDRTPAALTPGEFIIPDDVSRWKGEEYFHKEIQKAREGRAQGAIPQGAAA